jgi:hypothetical protein
MTPDTNPVQHALDIENIATKALIESLQAQMNDKQFQKALTLAIHTAVKNAPPACCFQMEKAVRRLATR